jgi:hypothetical protein
VPSATTTTTASSTSPSTASTPVRSCFAAIHLKRNWIKIKLVGTKSNRTGIGSRVTVSAITAPDADRPLVQTEELRSGGSYFSQNDLRIHFGLDQAKKKLNVQYPSEHRKLKATNR